ncbi:transposon Ty3-I Gag-Pol polyprotein [Trichonephila clavipes]|uniref:Transposon Ty3-I Gag-Pol polyprotein n=1 Tax=Trichonephila clavipes TaxID=2585209 RepID=A0A8X6RWJ9_TRICX|nr:transposon Ty3-I Gag-Pol polyprotein [Trichonephila clavipes]
MEEMHHLARKRIGTASEKMMTRYDARATGHDFHEGEKVWLWNPKRPKELFPYLQTTVLGREFPGVPYHITLKDNAVPVIHPPRRVPLDLQPKLKITLDRLEKEGILSKVNKPTDWVQSLVIVEKPNGNLRSCLC